MNQNKPTTDNQGTWTGHYVVPESQCSQVSGCHHSALTRVPSTDLNLSLVQEYLTDLSHRAEVDSLLAKANLIDPQLRLADGRFADDIARTLLGSAAVKRAAQDAILCVLGNIWDSLQSQRLTSVSLSKGSYSIAPRYQLWHYRYPTIKAAVSALEREGLVAVVKGSRSRGLRTRLIPSSALVKEFEANLSDLDIVQIPYGDELVLKDSRRRLIDYRDTRERNRWRRNIQRHTELVSGSNIRLPLYVRATSRQRRRVGGFRGQHRVFNDGRFSRGGRQYGGFWQLLPGKIRRRLLVDGASLVELDYSSLHPHMLYHQRGLELPDDPYVIGGDDDLRPVGKLVLLIGLNAPTRNLALSALRHEIGCDDDLKSRVQKHGQPLSKIFDAYLQRHAPIADCFGKGVGVRLQRWDGDALARVLNHFTKKGVVTLPVHDSVLVPSQYEDELLEVMRQSYRQDFGREIPIKVKRAPARRRTKRGAK